MNNIGKRIRLRRKEIKMSADRLAKILGKDRSTIFRYEKGDIENIPLELLEKLAEALETTPEWILGWSPERNDNLADIILLLKEDDGLTNLVGKIVRLSPEKRITVEAVIDAFATSDK